MDVVNVRKQRFLSLVKSREVWVIVGILLLAFVLRFVLAVSYAPPAQWWDSGDYLTGAKEIAGIVDLDTYDLSPRRPFFLSAFWGFLLKLGGSDTTLLFFQVVFSVAVVWLTYLLGKRLFSLPIAWIAAFLSAVFWQYLFHTTRLLTDLPSLAFWLACAYFFWRGYGEEGGTKYLIWSGVFFGLAWFTRAASVMYIVPLLAVVLVKDRWRFLLNKKLWVMVLAAMIIVSPFIIWLFASFDNPIQKFTGIGGGEQRFAGRGQVQYLWLNLAHVADDVLSPVISGLTSYKSFLGFLLLLVVFVLCSRLFFGFDVLWKSRDKQLLKYWFLLTWMLTPYIFYSLVGQGVEDRYLFGMFPVLFLFLGDGLVRCVHLVKSHKAWAIAGVILLLGVVGYFHMTIGINASLNARMGFAEVALGGVWMKEHSTPNDSIMTASKYQNMYYSERNTYAFVANGGDKNNDSQFYDHLAKVSPKFVVLSKYEPAFTPQWAYTLIPSRTDMFTPVQAYYDGNNQVALVVYEYKKSSAE
ncbi:MAG TPA: glycosyltransferase family 39 protein [Candidatus Nanoarchaeia archaeon]|nr:glycosyltransferase family 39 protein [Candidatus Nanoarchaeia archaeon]